jgi:hypothetical protein
MKSSSIVCVFLLSLLVLSCTDTLTNVGASVQPASDEIAVGTDSFHVSTQNIFVDSIVSKPDSFLLGSFYDEKYGSTQADILAQVQGPIDYDLSKLKDAIQDSLVLRLGYNSYFGDKSSPMEVSVYEMNKGITFDYSKQYWSNIKPSLYADINDNNRIGDTIFTVKDASNIRKDSTSISIRLSKTFRDRFFKGIPSRFLTDEAFLDLFKGMYITANFGASTILNVTQIDMVSYYHYTYNTKTAANKDTTITVKDYLVFPANSGVRQVNRFVHKDVERIKLNLAQKDRDTINYISSPANIQTIVNLPLKRIQHKMDSIIGGKKQTLNSALLRVEASEVDQTTLAQPTVKYLLLIKESAVKRFFENNELPSDTCAVLGQYTTSTTTANYYTFNLATLIANELNINNVIDNKFKMRLVPVQVVVDASGNLTKVKQQYLMSAVTIRSGKDVDSNGKKLKKSMTLRMVYSGF